MLHSLPLFCKQALSLKTPAILSEIATYRQLIPCSVWEWQQRTQGELMGHPMTILVNASTG